MTAMKKLLIFALAAANVMLGQLAAASGQATGSEPWRRDLTGTWLGPYTSDLTRGTTAKMTPWGEEKFAKFDGRLDPCLPVGVTRQANAPDPIQIVQTKDRLVIMYESWHEFRSIAINGPAPTDLYPSWLGKPTAKWDGDALVITTVGLNDITTLDTVGHPHSEELKLTERLERTGPATMSYEVTVDDPKAYVAPFKQSRVFKLMPNTELMEYVCLENEKDRDHLVGIKK